MSAELLNCPLCHSSDVRRLKRASIEGENDLCQCRACGCSASLSAWNTRASQCPITPFEMPELNDELRGILGTMCFQCIRTATRLREMGVEIKTRAEDEQAVVLHYYLSMYFKHGENWIDEVNKQLKRPVPPAEPT